MKQKKKLRLRTWLVFSIPQIMTLFGDVKSLQRAYTFCFYHYTGRQEVSLNETKSKGKKIKKEKRNQNSLMHCILYNE